LKTCTAVKIPIT